MLVEEDPYLAFTCTCLYVALKQILNYWVGSIYIYPQVDYIHTFWNLILSLPEYTSGTEDFYTQ